MIPNKVKKCRIDFKTQILIYERTDIRIRNLCCQVWGRRTVRTNRRKGKRCDAYNIMRTDYNMFDVRTDNRPPPPTLKAGRDQNVIFQGSGVCFHVCCARVFSFFYFCLGYTNRESLHGSYSSFIHCARTHMWLSVCVFVGLCVSVCVYVCLRGSVGETVGEHKAKGVLTQ